MAGNPFHVAEANPRDITEHLTRAWHAGISKVLHTPRHPLRESVAERGRATRSKSSGQSRAAGVATDACSPRAVFSDTVVRMTRRAQDVACCNQFGSIRYLNLTLTTPWEADPAIALASRGTQPSRDVNLGDQASGSPKRPFFLPTPV